MELHTSGSCMQIDDSVDTVLGTLHECQQKWFSNLHGSTYNLNHAIEMFQAVFLEHSWVHVILKVMIIYLQ